jgi:acetyl-CoA C-acetyltransferase
MDSRAPLIAGAGQVSDHGPATPPELMVEAIRRAAADAGPAGEALLRKADSLAVVNCLSWPVPDPGSLLAAELGIEPRETVYTPIAGNSPLVLLADLCLRIASGEIDVAMIVGAEAVASGMDPGSSPELPAQPDDARPTRTVGETRDASHPAELAAGLLAPIHYYPLLEHAVRGDAGRSRGEHRTWLGELWGRFAEVARDNEHAWVSDPPDAAAISTPGPDNRRVCDPYLKLMNANLRVNQGAALLLCSAEAADSAGLAADHRVHIHATSVAQDQWFVAEREQLARSPAVAACGAAVFDHTNIGIDEIAHIDLYSCFPSAVQIAAAELGLDLGADARTPTVTGGLTFAGGPGSNYVSHSLATLSGKLRADPDSYGLVTGVAWYMTKHAVALLSARPPREPCADLAAQARIDVLPKRELAVGAKSEAVIESYTAVYDREGNATSGIVAALLPDGRRAVASSDDPATVAALLDGDPLDRPVQINDGGFTT